MLFQFAYTYSAQKLFAVVDTLNKKSLHISLKY